MNSDASPTRHVDPSPWRIVPFDGVEIPEPPAAASIQASIKQTALRAIGAGDGPDEDPGNGVRFCDLDVDTIAAITPSYRPPMLSPALDAALEDWCAPGQPSIGRAFVCRPHAGLQSALAHWGRARGFTVVEAPDPQLLVGCDESLLDVVKDVAGPIVVPALERWFLRHPRGLDLVRRLWDRILHRDQRWIVGCDSWAWAFLRNLAPIDELAPHTLAPLDAAALERWLRADWTGEARPPFRHADDESPVFRDTSDPDGDDRKDSAFFRRIAGHSRGLAPIALAMWRRSLSERRDTETDERAATEDAENPEERIFWVRPWDDVDSPSIKGEIGQVDALALHAILLHGGLPAELLERAAGLRRPELDWSLRRLARRGVLACDEGRWRTTELGYPVVRRLLLTEGYLTDEAGRR